MAKRYAVTKTWEDRIQRIMAAIDEEIAKQTEIAAETNIESRYRYASGRISGLELAKRLIEETA